MTSDNHESALFVVISSGVLPGILNRGERVGEGMGADPQPLEATGERSF